MTNTNRQLGFTLVELVIAMVITAVIGLSVVIASSALSAAQASTDCLSENVQAGRVSMRTLESDIRRARLVLSSATPTALMLWKGDSNGDKVIDLDEIVLLEWVSDQHLVQEVTVTGMPGGLNTPYTLAQAVNFAQVRQTMMSSTYGNYRQTRTLAENVGSLSLVISPAPPSSKTVLARMQIGPADQRITLTNTINLRADSTADIKTVRGTLFLRVP